jgi:hypothetical protein
MFENRALRKGFGLKGEKVAGGWRDNYIVRNFIICTLHKYY